MAKLVEVDEEQWNRLTKLAGVAQLIHNNPEGRKLLERAQKIVDPKAPTPTLDQESVILAPVQEVQKQISDLTKLITEDREKREADSKLGAIGRQQDEAFARLRNNDKYTEEGIEAVRKIMNDKGILDPIDAAILLERYNPPQPMTPTGSRSVPLIERMNNASDEAMKSLLETRGESSQALDKLIQTSLDDFRSGRG